MTNKERGKEISPVRQPGQDVVRHILSEIRKTKEANAVGILRDEEDVAQVIAAFHAAGYVIVPKSVIDEFNDWIRRINA